MRTRSCAPVEVGIVSQLAACGLRYLAAGYCTENARRQPVALGPLRKRDRLAGSSARGGVFSAGGGRPARADRPPPDPAILRYRKQQGARHNPPPAPPPGEAPHPAP